MLSGCRTNRWNDVPLTEGDVPFILPKGTEIVDKEGFLHILGSDHWVVSETDLYDAILYLKQKRRE